MEVLLGTFDGFVQNCDLQIDSFRAYLLEFLELQVSGDLGPSLFSGILGRRPGVRRMVRAGGGLGACF